MNESLYVQLLLAGVRPCMIPWYIDQPGMLSEQERLWWMAMTESRNARARHVPHETPIPMLGGGRFF